MLAFMCCYVCPVSLQSEQPSAAAGSGHQPFHLRSAQQLLSVPQAVQKAKTAAVAATGEVKKSAGKVTKKVPRAKKALKRMVFEIDAEVASECTIWYPTALTVSPEPTYYCQQAFLQDESKSCSNFWHEPHHP